MLITRGNLNKVFSGYNTVFNNAFESAESRFARVAMEAASGGEDETYTWLGEFPKLREWLGDRVVHGIAAQGYTVRNRLFEMTVSVPRTKIEDDRFGVFAPRFAEMGRSAKVHPDELIFNLLGAGFETLAYDGQYFFDTDHPVVQEGGATASVSNMQAGDSTPWYLLDTSRAVKPLIWQTRIPYTFQNFDRDNDDNVFWKDEFVYGVRARVNAGLGLWQLAFASKAELNAENYEAARLAMQRMKGDNGHKLNINPTTLVVPPELEGAAKRLLQGGSRIVNADNGSGAITPVAVTNEWAETADLIVTSYLD